MLGARLRSLRTKYGYTQNRIAEALNIDRSTYTYYETGKTKPDIDTLKKLSSIFHVSIDFLVENLPRTSSVINDTSLSYMTNGNDSDYSLTNNERILIDRFRSMSKKEQTSLLEMLAKKNDK